MNDTKKVKITRDLMFGGAQQKAGAELELPEHIAKEWVYDGRAIPVVATKSEAKSSKKTE